MHMALGFACTVLLFFFVLFQALIHSHFQDWKWKVLAVAVVLAELQRSVKFKSSVHKSTCINSQVSFHSDVVDNFNMYSIGQICIYCCYSLKEQSIIEFLSHYVYCNSIFFH